MAEITKEVYEQALNAQNADEIARIAESAGIKLEKSEAEALFARLRSADVEEVADEELDNVAGGSCLEKKTECEIGKRCVWWGHFGTCKHTCAYFSPSSKGENRGLCSYNPYA